MSFYSSKAFTDLLLALNRDSLKYENTFAISAGTKHFFKKFIWLDFEIKDKAFYEWLDSISKTQGIYAQILYAKTSLTEPKLYGYNEESRKTFIIDLRKTKEELLSNIDHNCRKNIRKCLKNGLIFREIKENEFEKYLELLKHTRKKLKLGMPPVYPVLDVWKKHRDKIKIFCIEKDNEIIYAMTVFASDGVLIECAIAYNQQGRNLYAGDLMKWGIIEWGNTNGFATYDLAGVSESEPKIFAYKQKFGGELVTYPVYTKIYSKSKDLIVKLKKRFL